MLSDLTDERLIVFQDKQKTLLEEYVRLLERKIHLVQNNREKALQLLVDEASTYLSELMLDTPSLIDISIQNHSQVH